MTEEIPDHLHGIKGRLFFQGKSFEEEKDFWEFVKKCPDEKIDQETAERLFKGLSIDCVMNIFIFGRNLKNKDLTEILEILFLIFLKFIQQEKYDRKDQEEK